MRLNLGSGQYPLAGYLNVDAYTEADLEGDIRELEFAGVEEVRMSHLLEHISWRETDAVLKRVHSWMAANGELTIEVPDMHLILMRGTRHPLWFKYVYGDQSHPGEYHLAGFTRRSLKMALRDSGWRAIKVRSFISEHRGREGMPCLEAWAKA